jgi:hypothetical protein
VRNGMPNNVEEWLILTILIKRIENNYWSAATPNWWKLQPINPTFPGSQMIASSQYQMFDLIALEKRPLR